MHLTLATAYRLVLFGDHSFLDGITIAPAITYALGIGALYGLLRLVRDALGLVIRPFRRRRPVQM